MGCEVDERCVTEDDPSLNGRSPVKGGHSRLLFGWGLVLNELSLAESVTVLGLGLVLLAVGTVDGGSVRRPRAGGDLKKISYHGKRVSQCIMQIAICWISKIELTLSSSIC